MDTTTTATRQGVRQRLPQYVKGYTDRHGRQRYYLRRPGQKEQPLHQYGAPWSPAFMTALGALLAGQQPQAGQPQVTDIGSLRTTVGSVNQALVSYYTSAAWHGLGEETRGPRKRILEKWRLDYGDLRLSGLQHQHLQNELAKLQPHAQRNMLKALRHFMAYAVAAKLITADPTQGITRAKTGKSKGFYAWTEQDIERFEQAYPIGTVQRLAFSLMLYLGVRRNDVVRIGPQHIRKGAVSYTPRKTRNSTGFTLECKLHPELAKVIDATKITGTNTFLITKQGQPFTAAGFGTRMREWCDKVEGLPKECGSHGLRKAICRRLIEAGASIHMVMSITGHTDPRQLEPYVREWNKKALAQQAMNLINAAVSA